METINLDAIYVFFKEEISPKELAELLDKLLYHYVQLLIGAIKEDNFFLHENTAQFIYFIKLLRDILPECEQ